MTHDAANFTRSDYATLLYALAPRLKRFSDASHISNGFTISNVTGRAAKRLLRHARQCLRDYRDGAAAIAPWPAYIVIIAILGYYARCLQLRPAADVAILAGNTYARPRQAVDRHFAAGYYHAITPRSV